MWAERKDSAPFEGLQFIKGQERQTKRMISIIIVDFNTRENISHVFHLEYLPTKGEILELSDLTVEVPLKVVRRTWSINIKRNEATVKIFVVAAGL